jgi:hypothetical protein
MTPNDLPEGWAALTLADGLIRDMQTGFACGVHNRNGEGVPHLRPMNVTEEGSISLSDLRFVAASETRAIDSATGFLHRRARTENRVPISYRGQMSIASVIATRDGRFVFLWIETARMRRPDVLALVTPIQQGADAPRSPRAIRMRR